MSPVGLWRRRSRGEEEVGERTQDEDEEDGEKAGEFDIATLQEDIFV